MPIIDRIPDRILNSFQTATITFNYLKTKGSSHRNPFYALAELTDNSKDAHAETVEIDFVVRNKQDFIEILDDGDGMTQEEVAKTVAFGYSEKQTSDQNIIGRYGNGLKSGGLRLGKELLLLTKKDDKFTAMMISYKFHEAMQRYEKVFVPCPCFDKEFRPVTNDMELHEAQVMAINAWGPLGGASLFSLFTKIQKKSGTLIIIGSLRRDLLGSLEMNVSAADEDVTLEGDELEEWESSLRKYLAILYMDSTMKILLRGREVAPKQLAEWFLLKRCHSICDITMTGNWAKRNAELINQLDLLQGRCTAYGTELGSMNNTEMGIDHESRRRRNEAAKKFEEASVQLKEMEREKKEHEKRKRSNVKINFNCGVNCKDRHNYGIYFYLNKRLIIAGYKNIPFFKDLESIGICMVICLTYDIVSPTEDKQGIENQSDFSKLIKSCSLVLNLYREYLGKEAIYDFCSGTSNFKIKDPHDTRHVFDQFWRALGYSSPYSIKCQQGTLTKKVEEGIHEECGFWRKCQKCLHWRNIRDSKSPPERFQCASRCKPAPDAPRYFTLVVRQERIVPQEKRGERSSKKDPRKPSSSRAVFSPYVKREETGDEPCQTELWEAERAKATSLNESRRRSTPVRSNHPRSSAAASSSSFCSSLSHSSYSTTKRQIERKPTLIANISNEDVTKRRKLNKNEEQRTRSTRPSEPSTSAAYRPYEDDVNSDDESISPKTRRQRDIALKKHLRQLLKHAHENPDFRITVDGGSSNIYNRMYKISQQIEEINNQKK